MTTLLPFWLARNFHLSAKDAKELYGIDNFDQQVAELRSQGILIKSEIRYDLKETFRRYWLDEVYREQSLLGRTA